MQISPRNQPPTQQILDAMAKLAEENVLGYANGATETLERMFQDRLCDLLNLGAVESGWTWQREIRFRTQALRNAESVSVDIFGRDRDGQDRAAIELKYVPTRQIGHHAPNPPAFPYDLIKDCLKVELLASGHSTPVDGSFAGRPAFGYAIGLTNVPKIINGTMKGWSRHFLSALRPGMAMDGGAFPLGPCMIESWSRSNLDGEPPRVYRRVSGSMITRLFRRYSRQRRKPPLLRSV